MNNKALLIVFAILLKFTAFSQEETLEEIEKKYGPQWDFCTCVVASDSIHAAIMQNDLTDAEFDVLIERSDLIDLKCKMFLIQSSANNSEERKLHERRVARCLYNADIKREDR